MSDPILHLTISQSPVFLLNSRLGLFTAAPLFLMGRLFSRSYEAILPSSLAMIHSSALGYSPRLPVSVYGTGSVYLKLSGFSWKLTWGHYQASASRSLYYRDSALMRIYLHYQRLHTSTNNSVCSQSLRVSVTTSQYTQVPEY